MTDGQMAYLCECANLLDESCGRKGEVLYGKELLPGVCARSGRVVL